MKTKEEIRSVIDQVENFDQQMLLRYRYLHHYSWETIAETMHFGTRWLHVLHGRALNSVDSILRFRNLE